MKRLDLQLAEELFARGQRFVDAAALRDALIDLSASCRLYALHQDKKAAIVHQAWVDCYNRYLATDSDKPVDAPSGDAESSVHLQLEGMLKRVRERRQPGSQ